MRGGEIKGGSASSQGWLGWVRGGRLGSGREVGFGSEPGRRVRGAVTVTVRAISGQGRREGRREEAHLVAICLRSFMNFRCSSVKSSSASMVVGPCWICWTCRQGRARLSARRRHWPK